MKSLKQVYRILLLLMPAVAFSLFTYSQTLDVQGKFTIDDGNSEGATITVSKNNSVIQSNPIKGSKFALDLDFNSDYVLIFAKPGYVTKKISIDTHVSEAQIAEGFEPLEFQVEIFKQYEGVNIVVFNQPVGKFRYMAEKDDFFYDTDYTKSILSQIQTAEKELAEKAKEEQASIAQAQQQQTAQAKAEEEARKVAEKAKAEEEKRIKAAEEKAIQEAKIATAKAEAEERAAAKAKEEEEKRKAAAALEEEKRKFAEAKAAEEARKVAEAKEEAERRAQEAKLMEEAKKAAEAKAEEERKAAAAKAAEEKRMLAEAKVEEKNVWQKRQKRQRKCVKHQRKHARKKKNVKQRKQGWLKKHAKPLPGMLQKKKQSE